VLTEADAYSRRRISSAVLKGAISSEEIAAGSRGSNNQEELDYAEFNPRESSEPV
jgi:hypothetical protein